MVAPLFLPGGGLTLNLTPNDTQTPERLYTVLVGFKQGLDTWKRQVAQVVNTNLAFSGPTSGRPTSSQLSPLPNSGVGFQYFDTTLNVPIAWDGALWRNGVGTSV